MAKIENIPEELCFPPGIISEVARFVLAKCSRKHNEFTLSAGLAFVSVVTGRKVIDETGTTPNLYFLNLGCTGSGKEKIRVILKEILRNSNLLSSEKFTSDSAFVNELMTMPSMICCSDEIGNTIQELSYNQASALAKNLCDAMTQAYSAAGSEWKYKGYADNTKAKTVDHPNFVLFGSGNSDSFFKALRPEKVTDGFVGRFTMFLSSNGGGQANKLARKAKDKNNPGADEYSFSLPVPETISEFIRAWAEIDPTDHSALIPRVKPHIIERTDEAEERLQTHFEEIHERLHGEQGTIRGDIWARASEKSAKFALLAALSRSSDLIGIEDADWAIKLSNFLTRRLIKVCSRHIAESPWDAKRLEILRRIQDYGRPIEHSDLLRLSRIKSKDFQELISNLMETGDIFMAIKPTKGRQATGYISSGAGFIEKSGWKVVTKEMIEAAKKVT